MRKFVSLSALLMLCPLLAVAVSGCGDGGTGGEGGGRQVFLSLGTAPVGGAFQPVGSAVAEVLNQHRGENTWKVQAKGTKGSQENIRRLSQRDLQLGLSNSAITYFAVRGESGWEQSHEVQAVVTMAPNVAMFITTEDSGIKSIADLKGKRVVCGPAGAGFEMFIGPILAEYALTFDDFTKLNDTQSGAVGQLADGSADAAFLGGAVPTASIQQACSEQDVYFIPFGDKQRQALIEKYPFFRPMTITKDKYSDLTEDFEGLDVGSMHLITAANQEDERIYQITKTIWEHRGEISHPAAKFINEENAARYTGTDFHPGAIRYYKEAGLWKEDGDSGSTTDEKPAEGDSGKQPAEGNAETPAEKDKSTNDKPVEDNPKPDEVTGKSADGQS